MHKKFAYFQRQYDTNFRAAIINFYRLNKLFVKNRFNDMDSDEINKSLLLNRVQLVCVSAEDILMSTQMLSKSRKRTVN